MTEIHGHCDQRFAAVRSVFEENFTSRGDVGAALSIYHGGDKLVDLWGGEADPETKKPWEKDTLVNVWSTTKGVTAACFARAVELGIFEYGDKVTKYWPEFGAAGKQDVTIAMLLSHQAGLCGFREPAPVEAFYDIETAADTLAAAEPFWPPGTQSGYHAITAGILASALLKRADGRTVGEFVKQELEQRCGLDISIGLPTDRSERCATMIAPATMSSEDFFKDLSEAQIAALANPPLDPLLPNTPEWRAAEIPSANGYATASALAKLYGALAGDGILNGQDFVSPATMAKATTVQHEGVDAVLGANARWACGFLCSTDGLYGPEPTAFGHSGWGGAFAFAHPPSGCALAYTMNKMGTVLVGDPRNVALIEAFYLSL